MDTLPTSINTLVEFKMNKQNLAYHNPSLFPQDRFPASLPAFYHVPRQYESTYDFPTSHFLGQEYLSQADQGFHQPLETYFWFYSKDTLDKLPFLEIDTDLDSAISRIIFYRNMPPIDRQFID